MTRRLIRPSAEELDEIAEAMLQFDGAPLHQGSPSDARALRAHRRAQRPPFHDPLVEISSAALERPWGQMALRSYFPPAADPQSVIVYCHGGGWVMGQPDDFDAPCAAISRASGIRVVSVDYRLAPEHRFPAALEDVVAAVEAQRGLRTFLVGESAGGGLAVAAAMACRDLDIPIAASLLFYPLISYADRPSGDRSRDTPLLVEADLAWCWKHYLEHPSARLQKYAAPGDCGDLATLGPLLVVYGDRDPISSSASRFSSALAQAGVDVDEWVCQGLPHAFTALMRSPVVRELVASAAGWLREKTRDERY